MCRFRKQLPDPCKIVTGNRRRDVSRRISQIHGEDLRLWIRCQQTRAERQNPPSICRRAFGKYTDYGIWGFALEFLERDQLIGIGGLDGRMGKGEEDGAEEAYRLDLLRSGVRASEDGVEDSCEVEGIERAREAAGYYGAFVRKLVLRFGKTSIIWIYQSTSLCIWKGGTYPLLTPSTCKSTHQTPGTANSAHSTPFFRKLPPTGSHSRTKK